MATPNAALRAARISLRLSQDDMARALREAGRRTGVPNDASKRLVQRWEAGTVTSPRPVYARALEAVTGLPLGALGFTFPVPQAHVNGDGERADGGSELDLSPSGTAAANAAPGGQAAPVHGSYSGVWLSRYEYWSSSREATFTGLHHVVILQHGNQLTVRSLPGSADSRLTIDLTVDGSVLTGTWTEQTAENSYYRGARYHGAVQLLAEPTGRRLVGKWVGFGKDMDINTGPWELVFQDASTGRATLDAYNRRPEA
jgi:transcriptional regulator with XRE-family HTH domain